MMKVIESVGVHFASALEEASEAKLRSILSRVQSLEISHETNLPPLVPTLGWHPDFYVDVGADDAAWSLVCEVKSDGQPRNVRSAALALRDYVQRLRADHRNDRVYAVLMAPFISPASAAICEELGVGYVDLAGNCRLTFGTVYIEARTEQNPFRSRRAQRSIFSPKSARLLRLLLAEPNRVWRVTQLAEQARVSLGQVSNLRQRLLSEEWAVAERGGVRLSKPKQLLDAWRGAYRRDVASSEAGYTLLHGEALDKALREIFMDTNRGEHAVLASFSASQWLAPFVRTASISLYADAEGESVVRQHLRLAPAGKGANVSLMRPKDEGVFLDRIEPASGIWCTSAIQTYLDLAVSGPRGVEAAEHLFNERIGPVWKSDQ